MTYIWSLIEELNNFEFDKGQVTRQPRFFHHYRLTATKDKTYWLEFTKALHKHDRENDDEIL